MKSFHDTQLELFNLLDEHWHVGMPKSSGMQNYQVDWNNPVTTYRLIREVEIEVETCLQRLERLRSLERTLREYKVMFEEDGVVWPRKAEPVCIWHSDINYDDQIPPNEIEVAKEAQRRYPSLVKEVIMEMVKPRYED